MPVLNEADAIYLGDTAVDAVYAGEYKVWPVVSETPIPMDGLVVWLNADNYTGTSWPNVGSDAEPVVVGTPPMTLAPAPFNGLSVVRFKANEGRLRGAWPHPVHDYTLIYLTRWVGPNPGRAFSVQYPPSNMLVGMHTSQPDTFYDNGTWLVAGTGWNWWSPGPGPWRMYGADSDGGVGSRFFIDGTQLGPAIPTFGAQEGFYNGWGISGYEAAGPGETIDIEVAEFFLYNRKLSDAERVRVEDYLRERWLAPWR